MATQTLTFSYTDTEGPAVIAGRLGGAWAGVLADHHWLTRAAAAHEGQVVAC